MRVKSINITDVLFFLFFLLSLLFDGRYVSAVFIVPLLMLVYHFFRIWQFRNSIELAFFLIFSATYPLYWLLAVILSVDIHYLSSNVDGFLVVKALSAQGLFLVSLFIGMRGEQPVIISQQPRRNSAVAFWFCISLMFSFAVVTTQTVSGSILDQSYDYETSGSSILFEYVLIPIIIAYAYSGRSKFRRYVLLGAAMVFVALPLYFGKRLPASMVAFAILLLFIRPRGLWQVAFIFVSGFSFLSLLAVYRVGESGQSLMHILLNVGDQGAMRNNQGGVVYSSAVYMKLTELGVFDWVFGLRSFGNVMLSIFLPSSMVDKAAYINFAAMEHIPIPGNGGLPGVAFYVLGRVFGVVSAGLIFGWLMARSRYSYLVSVYVSFLFFSFPRWMAYNVNIMFKAGVLLIVGWLLVRLVIRIFSSARHDDSKGKA